MSTGLAVETTELVKVFGDNRAVDGVDPAVPTGTVHGVLAALKGLPEDVCPCPHRGYLLKGRLKMRHADSESYEVCEEGQAFCWAPGPVPEALEDCEYVDFSPTKEFGRVADHVTAQG
ncbi:hypothetical protein OG596_19370 [Streptomyces sp. NBC_01102]|nr:hypothetical protein OG596_19370 [Streptomyces sp. NBC_01102]